MYAVIVSGEADWADVVWLVSVILAWLFAAVAVARGTVEAAVVPIVLGGIAFGLLLQ